MTEPTTAAGLALVAIAASQGIHLGHLPDPLPVVVARIEAEARQRGIDTAIAGNSEATGLTDTAVQNALDEAWLESSDARDLPRPPDLAAHLYDALTHYVAIEAEARQQDASALREADEAASIAHDYIWPQEKKPGVTREEASDAIWTIHNALRPLLAALPPSAPAGLDGAEVVRLLKAVSNSLAGWLRRMEGYGDDDLARSIDFVIRYPDPKERIAAARLEQDRP